MLFEIHIVHFLNAYLCLSNSAPLFWDISQCRVNGYYRAHTVRENNRSQSRVTIMLCGLRQQKSFREKKLNRDQNKDVTCLQQNILWVSRKGEELEPKIKTNSDSEVLGIFIWRWLTTGRSSSKIHGYDLFFFSLRPRFSAFLNNPFHH